MRRLFSSVLALAIFAAPLLFSGLPRPARAADASLVAGLHWRLVGPFRAGRALAVTGVPGNPDKFYFGAVGGGVWQSDNDGRTWSPIFDGEHIASIGAIAVAPSDPNVLYVGSGEADMRSDIQQGDGMYKSTDAGKTWSRIGLTDTRQIGKIVVDPQNPNVVYVAAMGHQYGPNAERGVFKSVDGGATWQKVLYKGPNVGAIDLSMDPANANVLYAALWQSRRPPWNVYPPSNGPGSGLFKSTDAGKTWTQLRGHGLPARVGRIGVAVSPANTQRVYAFVDTNDAKTGGIFRSDDAGATWTRTDGDRRVWTRGWYFAGITADPKNPNIVYVCDTSMYRSTDAGKTFIPIKGAPGGDDYHTLWIEPNDPSRMILGSDQGVVVSVDDARTWSSWYNQPTGQFYHAATDNRFPYWIYGAQQDSGAMAIPSRTIHTGISAHDWRPIDVGGESGTIAADPLHPGLLFGSTVTKEQFQTGWEQTIDPTLSHPDTIWRATWTEPIVASPIEPHVFYVSRQRIFRTDTAGATWTIISPDLTRKHLHVPSNLDASTAADNLGLRRRGVVYWIAPSPVRARELWAGTDDGLVWLTRDEGAHWKNVTPPQLTPWSKVAIIDASHFDADSAYVAVDRHRLDDNHPYIYRTHDGGAHWTLTTRGIPANQFVNVVREDPHRRGLVYAGTDRGIFVSFDDGTQWQPLQLNLPTASIRDITFRDGDIIIATHGRALWVLDDASPLRQLNSSIARSQATLFKPETAMIFQRAQTFGFGLFDEGTPFPPETPQGANPPWGAILDYYVGSGRGPLVLTIADAHGAIVRRYASTQHPPSVNLNELDIPAYWVFPNLPPPASHGAHRFVWDLRDGSDRGPIVPPGNYRVELTMDGRTSTQPLVVKMDPRVHVSTAALQRQFTLEQQIQAEIARVDAAQSKAAMLLRGKGLTAARRSALQKAVGVAPPGTPDNSEGVPAHDFTSLRYIGVQLRTLLAAVESAPADPTPEYRRAFALLGAQAAKTTASAMARP